MTKLEWLEKVTQKIMATDDSDIKSMLFYMIRSDDSIEIFQQGEFYRFLVGDNGMIIDPKSANDYETI